MKRRRTEADHGAEQEQCCLENWTEGDGEGDKAQHPWRQGVGCVRRLWCVCGGWGARNVRGVRGRDEVCGCV